VAQPANTDDADPAGGGDVEFQQRTEHGDTAAKQRAGGFRPHTCGQRNRPCPVRAHPVGKSAVVADDGRLRRGAQVLVAINTGGAVHAAGAGPAHAYLLAFAQALDPRAHRNDAADYFVTRHQRVSGHAPFVVDHRQVRMAHAAILDGDFDLLITERAGIVIVAFQFLFSGCGRPRANLGHGCDSVNWH